MHMLDLLRQHDIPLPNSQRNGGQYVHYTKCLVKHISE